MSALRLQALHYRLSFLRPFGVAHGTRSFTDAVYVRASFNGHEGYGEAAVPPYLGYDTPQLVRSFHSWFPAQLVDSQAIRQVMASFTQPGTEIPKPLRCAVDLAMHDLLGKLSGLPVRTVFGIPEAVRECAFTIGIGSVEDVLAQVEAHPQITLFKMKLGGPNDRERVEALLQTGHSRFCVDANQAWKSVEAATDEIRWLTDRGCLFVEQPMPVSLDHELPRLK
ncbi:MAG: enolase C-terminal domain-like protein, partial [Bacteroidota bacterium]